MFSATSGAVRAGARRFARYPASIGIAVPSSNHGLFISTSTTKAASLRPATPGSQRVGQQQRHSYATTTNPNPPLGKKNASNDVPSRIGLIGARGYTGQALIDLLNDHPFMDLRYVSSRELAGQKLDSYTKRDITYANLAVEEVAQLDKDGKVDCWVMALPNGVCKPYIEALNQVREETGKKTLIVDLSADYRFDDTWTYGLPELTKRSAIAQSKNISNPGCFATGAQLALAPLSGHCLDAHVFGVSGYSGAGTKPSPKNDLNNLRGGIIPYSLTGHIHEKEISHHLNIKTAFLPHVAEWFRGIQLTVSIDLNQQMTSRDIRQIYQDRYAGEKLVKVSGEAPLVRKISGQHGCELGAFSVDSTGKRVVVCATIDNLNKGAKNMNLALGYDEFQGIPTAQ
ncbi:protein arg-6 [Emericellopsis cladophorae]|uniref:Protein arg-6 n=1 Tax=Emericellopsis cladophorae TaxID=2686198 RepID=A0A9P9Y9S2_9HYPO|nr:protein arg-6 [Emericellopsis cladophorae]KAI6785670.1 protein arg-6 [Emericellopsis cladophorae]